MPIVPSDYRHPRVLYNHYLQTIYPALLRKVETSPYRRERIDTPDGDFLDLDWAEVGSDKLVVISHGLEGSSDRPYIRGMARIFNENGYDVLAWNYRGCSEEINRTRIFYHSGATYDLHQVVTHGLSKAYTSVSLVGFSLGGNMTLKYLGESTHHKDARISNAVVFSVPLDLESSCEVITHPSNRIYSNRFIRLLKDKVRRKQESYPAMAPDVDLDAIKTIYEFDDVITAPLHGFKNAHDYYQSCSSIHFLENIEVPIKIVNAANDSFLSEICYPQAIENMDVNLEYPGSGGHVGFTSRDFKFPYWSEKKALEFVRCGC